MMSTKQVAGPTAQETKETQETTNNKKTKNISQG